MSRYGGAAAVAASLVLVLAGPVDAHADRTVSGAVVLEAPTPDVARCAWLQWGEASQGKLGWVIALSAHEADGTHDYALTATGPVGDLGVSFYADLGTCHSTVAPLDASHGIPAGARYAVIGRWDTDVRITYGLPVIRPGLGAATEFSFQIH